jgi:hypothetical protein
MQTKLIKISVLALSMGLLGGCTDFQPQIDAAKASADAAMARANDAYNLAQNAHTVASEAAFAADKASKDAQAALTCCNENSRRLDKAFEKTMQK